MSGVKASTPDPIANGGSEGPQNAIQYNTSQKWCAAFATPTLLLEFPREICIDEFTYSTGNDCPDRDPTLWIFEGSTNQREWVPLHHQKTEFNPIHMRNHQNQWFSIDQ